MYNWTDERIFNQDIPTHIEFPNVPVGSILKGAAKYSGDHIGFIYRDLKITYNEVYREALLFSNALKDLGIGRGTIVSTHLPTCPQHIAAYYGIMLSGATFSPLNPYSPARDIIHQLNDSNASVVITHENVAESIREVASDIKIDHVIVTGDQEMVSNETPVNLSNYDKSWLSFAAIKASSKAEFFDPGIDPKEDVAHIAYTGGTTGTPRGCMITHANLISSVLLNAAWASGCLAKVDDDGALSVEPIEKDEKKYLENYTQLPGTSIGLSPAPLFHVSGIYGCVIYPVVYGNTTILVDRFDPVQFLELIEEHKATTLGGSPSMWNVLMQLPQFKNTDFSTVTSVSSSTAPFAEEERNRLMRAFTNATYSESYGQTETSGNVTSDVTGLEKIGSVGHPLYNTKMKLISLHGENDEPLPPGVEGEICVKGPQIMKGYYNNSEETKNAFINGWLKTGDIGILDEDNFLSIVDRKKDMLLYNSYNVYPTRLEGILFEHPDTQNVAVIGKPQPIVGEIPKAFIVLKEGSKVTEEEMMDFINDQVVHYAKIREMEFVDELPTTAAGKLSKVALRKMESEKSIQQ